MHVEEGSAVQLNVSAVPPWPGSTQFRSERKDFYNPLLNAYTTADGVQMQVACSCVHVVHGLQLQWL